MQAHWKKRITRLAVAAGSATLVLAGCGGGGGDIGVRPDATPRPTTIPQTQVRRSRQVVTGAATHRANAEYRGNKADGTALNWAFDSVNAAEAFARLETKYGAGTKPGAGQRIAVIDSGIDLPRTGINPGHPEFQNAVSESRVTETALLGAMKDPRRVTVFGDWETSHGTAVTSLILADKDTSRAGWSFHGMAYGANVDVYGIPLGSGDRKYRPASGDRATIRGDANAVNALLGFALVNNPLVVNMSFGYRGIVEQYLSQRGQMQQWLKPLLDRVKASTGTIFVASAGNNNGAQCTSRSHAGCSSGKLVASSPSFDAALPVWDSSGEVGKRWVAAVAITQTGALASFSNRCGRAAKYCLAAPGEDILVAYTGENPHTFSVQPLRSYTTIDGTSFSAPLVSSGIAVVKQYFGSTLTAEQVLQRIYATADRTPDRVVAGEQCPAHLDTDGDRTTCELSSTHGQGIMNLDTATRPVGSTLGHGTVENGAVARTLVSSGHAPVVFDSLGYPFQVTPQHQAVAWSAPTARIPSFLTEETDTEGPQWHGMHWQTLDRGRTGDVPEKAGRWAFASATDAHGAVETAGISYASTNGAWKGGIVTERNQLHGGKTSGSYTGFLHHTAFVTLNKSWDLGRLHDAEAKVEASTTMVGAGMRGNGTLQETNGIYTAHAVHLNLTAPGRRTRLSLEAPLRAMDGRAKLKVPVGGTLHDGVKYAHVEGDLEPSKTELRLSGQHDLDTGSGRLVIGAGARLNPGHQSGDNDWHAGLQWKLEF